MIKHKRNEYLKKSSGYTNMRLLSLSIEKSDQENQGK